MAQLHNTAPDERIARRVVLVSGVAVFIIFGIRLSFSVFFAEFVSAEGWSNEAAASIFSVSMLAFALGSAPSGALLDRFGPRITFTGGALLLALGLFLSSTATTIEQLTIAYGLIGGLGLSVMGLGPVAANVAGWVPMHRRGRAIGVAFAGTGLGSLIFVPLANFLIDALGWRGAYLSLSLLCIVGLAPLLAWGQRRPPPPALPRNPSSEALPKVGLRPLLRKPAFWLLLFVSFNALGPLRSLTVHQVAYIESTGIPRSTASAFVGLAGFLTAITFVGWGWVSDRWGRGWAFSLGALCLAGAVGVLILLDKTHSIALLPLYSLLLALGEGTRSSQTTALASDVFSSGGLGLVNGIVGAMFGLGAAFGPWIVGRLKDLTGSYGPGLLVVVIMVTASVVGFLMISYLMKRQKK